MMMMIMINNLTQVLLAGIYHMKWYHISFNQKSWSCALAAPKKQRSKKVRGEL